MSASSPRHATVSVEQEAIASARNPQPYDEDPPLVDSLAAHVLWACSTAMCAMERIDEMQDRLDER